jgi:uncharacterized protein with HEPN domain
MAYDLEEQEQIATLKAWWNQYGNMVTWFVTAVLVAFAAWSGWKYYQRDQSSKGVMLYEEIVKAAEAKDQAKLARATEDIKARFGGTPYAQMGLLLAAKASFESFGQDTKTIFAVTRAIQIVGEAVKKIPDNIRQKYPQVPWKDVAKMRDKVTHQYFAVKLDVVWDTVQQDFPLLQTLIADILENFSE